ncbi:thiol:disulfide interchange protein DsbC [Formivibrio citricus]|uniref:Thiol:disulfide interchange protein n=1 Tax=Formivibrio citricus TaxID=83765 RepID=A0A1I4ZRD3_9NEIS|nr:DsbC family protein [Formivibrio citricus]SFN52792.1 thiol:disulfide interchange protein DsbC [Formivibrio citricus]
MNLKQLSRSLVAAGLIGLTACSASAESPKQQMEAVKATLAKQLQGKEITAVNASPMKGVFEVVLAGNMIVYTDAKAEFLIFGDMVDVAKRKSVTEERMAELRKVDFSKLPLEQAVKVVRGDGSRQLAVFSDPDCPFCKKLEQEGLKDLKNVTIYTFLMPLAQLHPDAARKSRLIWCAPDRAAAWTNWALNGKLPEGKGDCENPVEKNIQLGEKLGINGTPGLVFSSGRLVPGAIPGEQIESLLGENKQQ